MAKISRKTIKEGLEQIPVETILLGVGTKPKLTAKQKEFARQVALGKPKAKAYRETYNSKGKPKSVGNQAYKLATRPEINMEIEAYKIALEAEKHRTPAQLKSLLIQQLVKHSLDEDFPPAQRVKCLELMGKLYEVGAFEERKTTTVIHESNAVKARLLEQLKTVINGNGLVKEKSKTANSLLEEIQKARQQNTEPGDPTHSPPPETGHAEQADYTHSIPHIQPSSKTDMLVNTSSNTVFEDVDFKEEKNVTGNVASENGNEEGEGGSKNSGALGGTDMGKAPHSDLDTI